MTKKNTAMPVNKQTWEHKPDRPSTTPPRKTPRALLKSILTLLAGITGLIALIGRAADVILRLTDRFSPRRLLSLFLTVGFFGGLFLVLAVIWYSRDLPDPNRLIDKPTRQSTQILDRTGQHVLYEIFDEQKRSLVTLDQIPRYVIDATLAAQDRAFYKHIRF